MLTGAGTARAESLRRPALHWSRAHSAESCIDPRTLAERVETFTGPVFTAASAAEVSIEAHVERVANDAFIVRVTVTELRGPPAGERVVQFNAQDCRKLDDAIAFLIAMTIDPELGLDGVPRDLAWLQPAETPAAEQLRRDLESMPPRAESPAPLPRGPASQPAPTQGPPPLELTRAWEVHAGATLGNGAAASTALGVTAGVARRLMSWLSVALQLRAAADLTALELDATHSVSAQVLGAALLGCLRHGLVSRLDAQLCLGPELGLVIARGHGFTANETTELLRPAALARLDVRYWLMDTWALSVSGTLSWDATPPSVYYEAAKPIPIFEAAAVEYQAALGMTHAF
jgi:hypothetical protein